MVVDANRWVRMKSIVSTCAHYTLHFVTDDSLLPSIRIFEAKVAVVVLSMAFHHG